MLLVVTVIIVIIVVVNATVANNGIFIGISIKICISAGVRIRHLC